MAGRHLDDIVMSNLNGFDDSNGFTAQKTAAEEWQDLDTFIVALGENIDGSGQYFSIQAKMSDYDAQEVALGLDTYSLSNERGASIHGGVLEYRLTSDELVVEFDERTADTLGVARRYQIRLAIDDAAKESLRSGLQRVFRTARLDTRPKSIN